MGAQKSGKMQRHTFKEGPMPVEIPSKAKSRTKKSAYLPTTMWAELERIAESETQSKGEPISVNWVLESFLRWAIDDYHRGVAAKKK